MICPNKKDQARQSNQERKQTIDEEKGVDSSCDNAVMIALLLFGGSSRVTATDQLSAAGDHCTRRNNSYLDDSDNIPHTAVSTDGVFKSRVMDTDEQFSDTLTKAGTGSYYCSVDSK